MMDGYAPGVLVVPSLDQQIIQLQRMIWHALLLALQHRYVKQ